MISESALLCSLDVYPVQGRTGGMQGSRCFEKRVPCYEHSVAVMRLKQVFRVSINVGLGNTHFHSRDQLCSAPSQTLIEKHVFSSERPFKKYINEKILLQEDFSPLSM